MQIEAYSGELLLNGFKCNDFSVHWHNSSGQTDAGANENHKIPPGWGLGHPEVGKVGNDPGELRASVS